MLIFYRHGGMNLLDIDVSLYDTLFLDRDGVINVLRVNDYVKTWDEFVFMPEILDVLKKWNPLFKHIIVVTNQRGVGKKLMTECDLENIHERMCKEIILKGGRIDKIYYCTALCDEDFNRKPNIGMAIQAKMDFPEIDFATSLMIGDSESDMIFARNAGMNGIKI